MLLGATTAAGFPQDRSSKRRKLLSETINFVRSVFPSVNIRVLDGVSAVNAQASLSNGQQIVDIFGGLAFHPAVQADALQFVLLHEIGHHLADGARMTSGSPFACDCAADNWAILEGFPIIRKNGCKLNIDLAIERLEEALSEVIGSIDGFEVQDKNCWCWNWPRRKQYLMSGKVPKVESCLMFSDRK